MGMNLQYLHSEDEDGYGVESSPHNIITTTCYMVTMISWLSRILMLEYFLSLELLDGNLHSIH